MNYIIDAYNVGHKISAAAEWLSKGQTEKAIPIILSHIQSALPQAGEIIAVFDGKSGNLQSRFPSTRIKIKFSKKPQTADDIIRNFIRRQANPSNWTVVSSDNEIVYTARDMGAKVQTAQQFTNAKTPKTRISENPEKYQPGNVDVDEWLKIFNRAGDK